MLEAVKDSVAVNRIVIASENAPKIPITVAGALLAVALLIAPIWGWYVGRERDKWWRASIAQSSAAVRSAVNTGSAEALATDDDVLKALGDTDAKLKSAEAALRAYRGTGQCGFVPTECVRE